VQAYQPGAARARPTVDARVLWAGGAAAALVAALVAVLGVMIIRGLFGIPVLAPEGEGAFGDASTGQLALAAAVGALLVTGLAHLLLLLTPRPIVFFGWIVALLTAFTTLLPFTFAADTKAQIATAALYLVLGIVTGGLVGSIATRAIRRAPGPGPRSYDEARGYDQGW
jgi:CBS domain-containing protein